jgi:hypothetical protein
VTGSIHEFFSIFVGIAQQGGTKFRLQIRRDASLVKNFRKVKVRADSAFEQVLRLE